MYRDCWDCENLVTRIFRAGKELCRLRKSGRGSRENHRSKLPRPKSKVSRTKDKEKIEGSKGEQRESQREH